MVRFAALKQWWFDFMARLRIISLLVSLPAAGLGVGLLSSCATATIDNAVPQAALEPPAQAAVSAAQPVNTGQYPNINVIPVGETAQFTATDEAATRALLDDAKAGQQAQGESTAAYQERLKRLRLLAKNHAKDTVQQIEAQ